jgi:hypothetical protein
MFIGRRVPIVAGAAAWLLGSHAGSQATRPQPTPPNYIQVFPQVRALQRRADAPKKPTDQKVGGSNPSERATLGRGTDGKRGIQAAVRLMVDRVSLRLSVGCRSTIGSA